MTTEKKTKKTYQEKRKLLLEELEKAQRKLDILSKFLDLEVKKNPKNITLSQ